MPPSRRSSLSPAARTAPSPRHQATERRGGATRARRRWRRAARGESPRCGAAPARDGVRAVGTALDVRPAAALANGGVHDRRTRPVFLEAAEARRRRLDQQSREFQAVLQEERVAEKEAVGAAELQERARRPGAQRGQHELDEVHLLHARVAAVRRRGARRAAAAAHEGRGRAPRRRDMLAANDMSERTRRARAGTTRSHWYRTVHGTMVRVQHSSD